jgi:hypothetical protein
MSFSSNAVMQAAPAWKFAAFRQALPTLSLLKLSTGKPDRPPIISESVSHGLHDTYL